MNFVNVTGYLSSGSSAVVDYIREFENCACCKSEIRFIRDPYGIIDLDCALTQFWENERASFAIWKFLDISKKWQRFNRHVWSPAGHSYKKFLNKDYYKISEKYIEKFTDFRAVFPHYAETYEQNYFCYVINRIRKNLEKKSKGKKYIANRRLRQSYFAHPSEEQFIEATRDYIEELFLPLSDNCKNLIVLDQALAPDDLYLTNRYFRNCKNIIVSRDPRDMYITNVFLMDVIAQKKGSLESGIKFVKHFKTLVERTKVGSDPCLKVRFEEFVLNYDKCAKEINSFLGLDNCCHSNPKSRFNPAISVKNIGIWKSHYSTCKEAIDYIYKELKPYCWD